MKASKKVNAEKVAETKNGAKNSIAAINEDIAKEAPSKKSKGLSKEALAKLGSQAVAIMTVVLKSEANYILEQIKRYVRIGNIVSQTLLKGDALEEWALEYLECGQSNARKYKNIASKGDEIIRIATDHQLTNATLDKLATLANRIKKDAKAVDKALATTTDVEQVNSIANGDGVNGNGKAKTKTTEDTNNDRLKSQNKAENWAENVAKMLHAFGQMDEAEQEVCKEAVTLLADGVGVLKRVRQMAPVEA